MAFLIAEVYQGSAALLNDTALSIFSYANQLPYLKIAYDELRQELEDNNIASVNKTSAGIVCPVGTIDIGGIGPNLPSDLIDIYELWERTSGSTNDFALMKKKQFLPKTSVSTAYFEFYTWNGNQINLPLSTSAIEVKIDYIGDPFANLIDENTQVRVLNTINYLKYKTAALCAEFIGENKERADSLSMLAQHSLDLLLSICIKATQNIATRRRPFSNRRRR